MNMVEEQIKALIIQYDDLIRYRKKLLDCNLAETLLSVIPIYVKDQDRLDVHLNEKIHECKRIKMCLRTALYKVSKLYAEHKENTQVKEYLDFAIFLSTVGDSNEESIALSNSEDCDLLHSNNTSLKYYFTDELINDHKLKSEALKLLTEEETIYNDDVFTLISKLNAEKAQREYFKSERDKLNYLSDQLFCLLHKYYQRVCSLDGRNETNRTTTRTYNHSFKIDKDIQIDDNFHSVLDYNDESSLLPQANFPKDVPSSEENFSSSEESLSSSLSSSDDSSDEDVPSLEQNLSLSSSPLDNFPNEDVPSLEQNLSTSLPSASNFPNENAQLQSSSSSVANFPVVNALFQSSLSSAANFPNENAQFQSLEEDLSEFLLLKEKPPSCPCPAPAEPSEISDSAVENELQNSESVQSSNSPTKAPASPSPIVPMESSETNDAFDIEFIDVNLSVDDSESTIEKNQDVDELETTDQNMLENSEPDECSPPPISRPVEFPMRKVYKCRMCGKSFFKRKSISKHLRLHNMMSSRLYRCKKCGKSYLGKQKLFKCPVCDVDSDNDKNSGNENETNLNIEDESEIEENDEPRNVKITPKPSENEIIKKENDLLQLDEMSSENLHNIVQCDICGLGYSHMYQLDKHLWEKHIGNKTYNCDVCGKQFAYKYELKNHVVIHGICEKDESKRQPFVEPCKPFKCSFCEVRFQRSCNRTTHEKTVHMHFPSKRVHKNVTPRGHLQCAHCDKRCSIKRDLESHLFTHHFPEATKQFQCSKCTKSFATKYRLKRHKSSQHP